jgi:hypothetical protein
MKLTLFISQFRPKTVEPMVWILRIVREDNSNLQCVLCTKTYGNEKTSILI